jgi:predicted alpha/beta hydrolase
MGRDIKLRRHPGRIITTVAVGFLLLDAVLLFLAGLWSDRLGLMLWGAGFGAAAVTVYVSWRRYLRHLRQLRADIRSNFQDLEQLKREFSDRNEA